MSHPAPPPPPTSPRNRALLPSAGTLALLLALGLGVLGGYLLFRDDSETTNSVEVACDIATRLESEGTLKDWGLDDPRMWEAQAIGPLLHAAALDNEDYKELGEVGDEVFTAITQVNSKDYDKQMDEVVRLCGDV